MKQIQKQKMFLLFTENQVLFSWGGKESWEQKILEGEDGLYTFFLGFHYVVRRGKGTSGKNCWDRA